MKPIVTLLLLVLTVALLPGGCKSQQANRGEKLAPTSPDPTAAPVAKQDDAAAVVAAEKFGVRFSTERVATTIATPPKGASLVLAARDGLQPEDYEERSPVYGFRFYDADQKIAAWYLDRAIRLWDVSRGERFALVQFDEGEHGASDVAFDPSTRKIYVGTDAPQLLELREDGTPLRSIGSLERELKTLGEIEEGLADVIGDMAITGTRMVVGASGYLVLDLPTLEPVQLVGYEPDRDDGPVVASCIALADDGKTLMWHDEGGDLSVFDVNTVKTLASMPGPQGPWSGGSACAAAADGSRVALAGGALMVYEIASKKRVVHLKDESIHAVGMSDDGRLVAYAHGEDDGMVSLLVPPAKKPHKTWVACPEGQIEHLALSSHGKQVAIGCDDDIIIWPTE